MGYLFLLLLNFIVLLLIMQIVIFEMTRNKMKKADNLNWFLSLDRPFKYTRVGYMAFICFLCYILSSTDDIFSVSWFIFFIMFLSMGIVSDAVVQFLVLKYSHLRCKKEIEEAKSLENELIEISQNLHEDYNYQPTVPQYDSKEIMHRYITNEQHISFMCIDGGEFVENFGELPEATFIVEQYGQNQNTAEKFIDNESIKVVKLTDARQLPFKDERLDTLICEKANYDKFEAQRVLKPGGYFIVEQNGTANIKEFLQIYMPFSMRGAWDAYQCAQTLEESGMSIVEKHEDYGNIRFYTVTSIHQYFLKVSPDLADINRYKYFYLKALKDIKRQGYFEMTTHQFIVVAKK